MGTVEHATAKLGLSHTFVGVIIVAIVGNAAEHAAAVKFAIADVGVILARGGEEHDVSPLRVFHAQSPARL